MDNHKIKTSHKISLRVHKITSIACSCTHHGHDFAHELNTHTYPHTQHTRIHTHKIMHSPWKNSIITQIYEWQQRFACKTVTHKPVLHFNQDRTNAYTILISLSDIEVWHGYSMCEIGNQGSSTSIMGMARTLNTESTKMYQFA